MAIQRLAPSPVKKTSRTMAGIVLEPSMLIDLKRIAAAQHWGSMSEMVRSVMADYVEQAKRGGIKV